MAFAIYVAICAAIVGATCVMTASAYGSLPDRVPIHYDFRGNADGYGPKPAIWLLVGAQILSIASFLAVPRRHDTSIGFTIFSICILGILWRGQRLMLEGAANGGRADMRGFWFFFVAAMAIGISALALFSRP